MPAWSDYPGYTLLEITVVLEGEDEDMPRDNRQSMINLVLRKLRLQEEIRAGVWPQDGRSKDDTKNTINYLDRKIDRALDRDQSLETAYAEAVVIRCARG